MFLQRLVEFYDRVEDDPEYGLPPRGCFQKKIGWICDLDKRELVKLEKPEIMMVPSQLKTNGVTPGWLCDRLDYVFGVDIKETPDRSTAARHQAFLDFHREQAKTSEQVAYMLAQLEKGISMPELERPVQHSLVAFRLGNKYLHEIKELRDRPVFEDTTLPRGICLLTGKEDYIERVHGQMPAGTIPNGSSHGTRLVSFKNPAQRSWGKTQGYNAGIGMAAAYKYPVMLTALMSKPNLKDRHVKLLLDGTAAVFWSVPALDSVLSVWIDWRSRDEAVSAVIGGWAGELEHWTQSVEIAHEQVSNIFGPPPAVVAVLRGSGARSELVSYREGSIQDMFQKIKSYIRDLAPDDARRCPSIRQLACCAYFKYEPPSGLIQQMLEASMSGGPWPRTWMNALVQRIQIQSAGEQDNPISPVQARALRASLIRNQNLEVPVALDKDNNDVPYVLGRLFYMVERTQKAADLQGIRRRWFAACSQRPAKSFPAILKLNIHHTGKIGNGLGHWFTEQIMQLMDKLEHRFPDRLSTEETARFMMGYYHERAEHYNTMKKKESDEQN